jgi:surface carbohydrate biosynthesis protein
MPSKNVVLLVDHKDRDLKGVALIAKHLNDFGIHSHIEPIDAWRAVLGAYKPDLILFNHTQREHLADFTEHLGKMGVLTAVLLNEGLLYNDEVRHFNSQRLPNLHLDYFFCWNEPHQQCLLANGYKGKTHVEVVGVPRFDLYFEPWSRAVRTEPKKNGQRPQILLCTNFGLAEWKTRPRDVTDRFFSQWKDQISFYADYWNAIEISYRSRLRFLDFLKAIVAPGKFDVVLKTHPRESRSVYEKFINELPAELQRHLTYVPSNANITPLILNCDLEISCEKCTTAMEAWMARKPTIELIFEKHPMFYDEAFSKLAPLCDSPEKIVAQIETVLANPEQVEYAEGRKRHLAKWCHSPDGQAAKRVATAIAAALKKNEGRKQIKLSFQDYRRALKLKTYQALDEPYTFFPLLALTHAGKFSKKRIIHEKSAKPSEVRKTLEELSAIGRDHSR